MRARNAVGPDSRGGRAAARLFGAGACNATCEMIEQQAYTVNRVSAERLGLAADSAPD